MAITTDLPQPKNLLGGRRIEASTGATLPVTDPATGEEMARVPLSGPADVDAAVKVAGEAAGPWAATPITQRARIMFRLHHLIEQNQDHLAYLVTRRTGRRKPTPWARSSAAWRSSSSPPA